jgi:hypothetical protein
VLGARTGSEERRGEEYPVVACHLELSSQGWDREDVECSLHNERALCSSNAPADTHSRVSAEQHSLLGAWNSTTVGLMTRGNSGTSTACDGIRQGGWAQAHGCAANSGAPSPFRLFRAASVATNAPPITRKLRSDAPRQKYKPPVQPPAQTRLGSMVIKSPAH